MSTRLPKVVILSAGGTITMLGAGPMDLTDYGEYGQALPVDEVVSRLDPDALVAEVLTLGFRQVSSTAIGPRDWLRMADQIRGLDRDGNGIDGYVVLHGTATLEETAYFLHLTVGVEAPVVITGAQRPISAVSTDAPLNLIQAIAVAASSETRGLGVLVALNGEVHSARDVTKRSTYKLEAFQSPSHGPLGYVDADGRVSVYRRPTRIAVDGPFGDLLALELPRVDVSYSYAGADGAAIDAFVAAGARGIVNAGLAPGKVASSEEDAVSRAIEAGVVMIRSTRAGGGRVVPRRRLLEQGVIPADDLTPQKARVLGMLALAVTDDLSEIAEMFRRF